MKRNILTLLVIILLAPTSRAQLKTYVSLEAGPSWDINRVDDPGNIFKQSLLYGSTGGVALWQEVARNLSLGTGLYYHVYSTGINPIDQRPHQPGQKSYRAVLIPARISYRIQFSEFPLSLTPRLGYQFGTLPEQPELREASSSFTSQDGQYISWEQEEYRPASTGLNLIETGFSMDYRFPNNLQLSLNFSHFSSLSETKFTDVNYTNSLGNNRTATYSSDGTRIQALFSLNIPVSNIWENEDRRLHRKIENTLGRGGMARNTRYIYFGGDIGAFRRSFATTNPAVGARPMDQRGVFRYSNLAAGGIIGYMFNESTGLDIGGYYHRANSFFSLMYDHETDAVVKDRAPFILEVPVMFRYYYDLHDRKLFLVPALGASVSTHFSGPSYASGSGNFDYSGQPAPIVEIYNYTAGRLSRFGASVKAGLGIEYDIPTPFPLLLTGNVTYSHGFIDIDQVAVTTSLTETPAENLVTFNGTGWNVSLGVRIPIVLGSENRKCGALPRIRR